MDVRRLGLGREGGGSVVLLQKVCIHVVSASAPPVLSWSMRVMPLPTLDVPLWKPLPTSSSIWGFWTLAQMPHGSQDIVHLEPPDCPL
eukprot:6994712-Pyramimonas_sp.AAC.1